MGSLPTPMVWTTAPVAASSSLTVLSMPFDTQTWVPSEETLWGALPTPMVWTTVVADATVAPPTTTAMSAPPNRSDPANAACTALRQRVAMTNLPLSRVLQAPA